MYISLSRVLVVSQVEHRLQPLRMERKIHMIDHHHANYYYDKATVCTKVRVITYPLHAFTFSANSRVDMSIKTK